MSAVLTACPEGGGGGSGAEGGATIQMCVYCFDVLIAALDNRQTPRQTSLAQQYFPLFVTWQLGRDRRLRGCIGTFESVDLQSGLRDYTLSSAFRDRRFSPISCGELCRLSVTVSLLTHFEPANDYRDWLIGTHGIRIAFRHCGRDCSATYLPQVAAEQGWDHVHTINSLLQKGGWRGEISEQDRMAVCVTRYQSSKQSLSYSEYLELTSAS